VFFVASAAVEKKESIDPDACFARHDLLVTDLGDGEIAMMSVEKGNYYDLNETAAAVWAQLETPSSAREIASRLARDYSISEEECLADLLPLLAGWSGEGLIELVRR
jgi:hypothetical protein